MKNLAAYVLLFIGIASCETISEESHSNSKKDNHTAETTIIDIIPFELTNHNNISVACILNEVDTLNLMFHTAASSMTLIETVTERIKSIDWSDEHSVESWGGKASSRYSENNTLQIGKLEWDSISIWEDKNSGPTTDGKFGMDLFTDKIVEINFDDHLIIIHSALPSKTKTFKKMNLTYEDGFMFLEGVSSIGGLDYTSPFLIHSGYGGTILYADDFAETSNIGEVLEIIDETELKDSFGNTLKTKKTLLPSFKLGALELKDIPAGFFEGSISNQSMNIIGGSLLKRFNLIIDISNVSIYLEENQLIDSEFSKM